MAPRIPAVVEPDVDEIKINKKPANVNREIVWRNVILMVILHSTAVYGGYLCFTVASWKTIFFGKWNWYFHCQGHCFRNVFGIDFGISVVASIKKQYNINTILHNCICLGIFLYIISGLGITGGAHRLWAHRSYKAKWPLRVLLCFFNTIAFQVNKKFLNNI